MKDGASWLPLVAVCGMDEYRVVVETSAPPRRSRDTQGNESSDKPFCS